VTVAGTNCGRAAGLRAFTARVRAVRRRAGLRHVLWNCLLPFGVLLIAALWWWPSLLRPLLYLCFSVTAIAALFAFRRGRRVRAEELLADLEVEAARAGRLRDEFATWLERDRDGGLEAPMAQWLTADLAVALAELPPPALRALGRRRLGRVRYLLPLGLILLLAWLLLQLWPPPFPGLLGGGSGGRGSGGDSGAGTSAKAPPAPGKSDPPPQQPIPPPPPPPPQPEPPPVQPEPPAPLLDLPEAQSFVVPQFTGDGDTRKALAQRALVEEGGGVSPPPAGAQQGGDQSQPTGDPAATHATFARAAEQALRSHHVPPAEQQIVRRFFELLQQEHK